MRVATAASVPALAESPPKAGSWRDLRVRVISACVLAPLGLACLFNGGWVFLGLVMLAMVGVGFEWAGLARVKRPSMPWLMLTLWPALALLATIGADWLTGLRVLAGGLVLGPLRGAGIVLTGLGGFALIWLRGSTGAGIASLLFVVLVVWSSDSLAYLTGRALGGAKLAPRISPGKTWSGALGGLGGAVVAGAMVALLVPMGEAGAGERLGRGMLFGALLGIAAQAGDLAESALKRRCGVKDSGRLIPGHGGLLDRLDGLLTAAPLAALLSLGCGPGQPFWQLDVLHPKPLDLAARHFAPGWLERLINHAA